MLLGIEELLALPDESSAAMFEERDLAALCDAPPVIAGGDEGAEQSAGEGGLLISIQGRIYDVKAGSKFYGRGRDYHVFTGRDASALLCTGCVTSRCILRTLATASAALAYGGPYVESAARRCAFEAGRWLEFFESHDKYPFVGVLPAQRALTKMLSPSEAEQEAGATATARALAVLRLGFHALLGRAQPSSAEAVGRALAFLRLGLHTLLGPRLPMRSRELLVELVLRVDGTPGAAEDPPSGSSRPLDAHGVADEAGRERREMRAELEAEALEDLADALRDSEGASDNDAVGVRAVARLVYLAELSAGLTSEATSQPVRFSELAARFAQTSSEFDRGDSRDDNRAFRPR